MSMFALFFAALAGLMLWAPVAAAADAVAASSRAAMLRDRLSPVWVETRFLEIELWQWLGLVLVIALATLFARLASFVLARAMGRVARRTSWKYDDRLVAVSIAPLRLLLGVFAFVIGQRLLGLPAAAEDAVAGVAGVLAVLGFAWLLLRGVDIGAELVRDRMQAQGRPGAVGLVPLGRRVVKLFLGALAVIAALQNLGMNVTGILAGLGVGGLAVALAAQRTVENFFGGATLVADQPVRVGDFCRFGDRVGTVEAVGLRSTRIRTLDRTVVTVPNAEFAVLSLENYTQRDRIWFRTVLGLRYETTSDQLRHVLVGLRKLLRADPRVDPVPARVRFVGFGAYSLDLEIFAYIRTRDIDEFLAIREDLLLEIMDCIAASGTGFAFPSQTVYATRDAGLDPERSRAAIEEARRWKQQTEPLAG